MPPCKKALLTAHWKGRQMVTRFLKSMAFQTGRTANGPAGSIKTPDLKSTLISASGTSTYIIRTEISATLLEFISDDRFSCRERNFASWIKNSKISLIKMFSRVPTDNGCGPIRESPGSLCWTCICCCCCSCYTTGMQGSRNSGRRRPEECRNTFSGTGTYLYVLYNRYTVTFTGLYPEA